MKVLTLTEHLLLLLHEKLKHPFTITITEKNVIITITVTITYYYYPISARCEIIMAKTRRVWYVSFLRAF